MYIIIHIYFYTLMSQNFMPMFIMFWLIWIIDDIYIKIYIKNAKNILAI